MGKISKERAVRRKVLFASSMPLEQLSKITDSKSFLWFQKFYKGFSLELKKKGRHDTIHNAPLEQESLKKIQELMIILLKLMRSDKTNIDAADIQPGYKSYQQLKEELPEEYKESWHILLPYAAMALICLLTGRRAREGLDQLKKSDFQKVYDSETKMHFYQKIRGELTKNHRQTSEDLTKGGKIFFKDNALGKNHYPFFDFND